MNVNLKCIYSCTVKRKKPWRKLMWLGKMKEDLLLVDRRCFRLLSLPLGHTKKRIASLYSFHREIVSVGVSVQGLYLYLLLKTGDIVIWQKDDDSVQSVHGLPVFQTAKNQSFPLPEIWVSADAQQIVVVLGKSKIFLWRAFEVSLQDNLEGHWSSIPVDPQVSLPSVDCNMATVEVSFSSTSFITCAFVFAKIDAIHLTVGFLGFGPTISWKETDLPYVELGCGYGAVNRPGTLISRPTVDGHLLALAVNLNAPDCARLVFFSLESGHFHVSFFHDDNEDTYLAWRRKKRYCWVADMAWSVDGALLVCIMNNGCVCVMSRLGRPLCVTSSIHSTVDLLHLELFPLPFSKTLGKRRGISNKNELFLSLSRQTFSLSTHCSAPIFVASDGHQITVLQLPDFCGDSVCLVRSLCLFARESLQSLHGEQPSQETVHLIPNFQELPCGIARGDQISLGPQSFDLDSGKIIPSTFVTREIRLMQLGKSTLIAAWALLASMDISWCEELDLLCRNIVWMTHSMFCILLGRTFGPKKWESCAIDFLCRCLDTVKFDRRFNMLSPTIKMVSSACRVLADHIADVEHLRHSFLLLIRTAETSLLRMYSYASHNSCTAGWDAFSLFCDSANYGNIVNRTFHPVICRLQSSWKRVYGQAFHWYQNGEPSLQFLCYIQRAIQDRGYCLPWKRKQKDDITLLHFFSGYKMDAIRQWLRKDFTQHAQRKETTSRRTHRILYALLSQGCIKDTVEFIYKFLFGERKKLSEKLFCVSAAVDDRDTRSLIASFSRFVALFLTENRLLLGLVGDPKPLPSLFSSEFLLHNQLGSRQTELLTEQGLECMLLPNLTLELLLLAGLWTEASNFALKFGCWQIALVLAVLHLWLLGKSNHDSLNPEFIVVSQLKDLYKDKLKMSSDRGLNDVHRILFPAMMCSVDPVPIFLNHLLDKLQHALADWKLLVPPEMYLPAPPIYCPQPFVECQENCILENSSEISHRHAVSQIVSDVFTFIRATHLDICLSSGYVHLLNVMWSALKLETNTLSGLNRASEVLGEGLVSVWVPSLQQCLQLFRRFCSMLWFINCRDQISLACRLLQNHLLSCQTGLDKFCNLHTNLCCSILEWAICVASIDGNATDSLHTIVLNAVWDLPPTDIVLHLLAKYLARSKLCSSSLKHKIFELTSRWNVQFSTGFLFCGDSREFSGSSLLFRAVNREEMDKLELHQKASDLVKEELGPMAADSGYEFFETCCSYVVFLESVLQIGLMKHVKLGSERIPYLVHYWHEQLSPKYIVTFSSAVQTLKSYRQPSFVLGFDLLSMRMKDSNWEGLHKKDSVLFHRKTLIEKQRHNCGKSLQRNVKFQNVPELLKRKVNTSISELQNSLPGTSRKLCSKSEEILQLLADLLSPKLKSLVCVYTSLHKWLCDEDAYGNSTVLSLLSPSIVLFLMVNSLHKKMPIPKRKEDITDRGCSEIALGSIDSHKKKPLVKEEKLSADMPAFIEVNSVRIESVEMPAVGKMFVNDRMRESSQTNALRTDQNTNTSTFVEFLEQSDTARICHCLKAKNCSNSEFGSGKSFFEDELLSKSRPLEENGIRRRVSLLPQVYVEKWSNRLLIKDKRLPNSMDNCAIPEVVLTSPLNRESQTVVKSQELLVDCIQDVNKDATEVNALCLNSLEDSIQDLKEDIREVRSNCQLTNDMQESFQAELKRMAKQLNLVGIGQESDNIRGTLQAAAMQTCSDIPSLHPSPTFLQMELVDQKASSNCQLRDKNVFPLLQLNVPSAGLVATQQETIMNNIDFCFHDMCPDKLLLVPDLNKHVEKPQMLQVDVYPVIKQLFLVSPLELKKLVEPHLNNFVTQCPELGNSELMKSSVKKIGQSVMKRTEIEAQETQLLMKTSTNDDIIEVFPAADPVEKLARPASRSLDCEFENNSSIQYKVHNVSSKSNTRYTQTTASAQTKLLPASSDAETSTDNLLLPGRDVPENHLELEMPNTNRTCCPRIVTVDSEANLTEQLTRSTHLTCSIAEERASEAYKATMTQKLKSMQTQLESIEKITSEVEREFVAAEELLKEVAVLTAKSHSTLLTHTINEDKGPIFIHQKATLHSQMTDSERKGRRRTDFEIRKRAVLDVLQEEHPLPKSRGRRISFGSTHTIIFPRSDSSDLHGDCTGSCQFDNNACSSLKVFR